MSLLPNQTTLSDETARNLASVRRELQARQMDVPTQHAEETFP